MLPQQASSWFVDSRWLFASGTQPGVLSMSTLQARSASVLALLATQGVVETLSANTLVTHEASVSSIQRVALSSITGRVVHSEMNVVSRLSTIALGAVYAGTDVYVARSSIAAGAVYAGTDVYAARSSIAAGAVYAGTDVYAARSSIAAGAVYAGTDLTSARSTIVGGALHVRGQATVEGSLSTVGDVIAGRSTIAPTVAATSALTAPLVKADFVQAGTLSSAHLVTGGLSTLRLSPYDTHPAVSFLSTFTYTGGDVTFVVPPKVAWLDVYVWGGGGGSVYSEGASGGAGGGGAFVSGRLPVTPGDTLRVMVGAGGPYMSPSIAVPTALYGGGGVGNHTLSVAGGCGGGRSALLTNAGSEVLVAGGGGGAGSGSTAPPGGPGGVSVGLQGGANGAASRSNNGTSGGGGSTTGSAGGAAGGGGGVAGGARKGADAAQDQGGAGGGGYYGGGAGGYGGAGGGGSSYVAPLVTPGTTSAGSGATPGGSSLPLRTAWGSAYAPGAGGASSGSPGLVVVSCAYGGTPLEITGIATAETLRVITSLTVTGPTYAGGLSSATVSTGTVGASVANLTTVNAGGLSSATVSTGTVGASVANLTTVNAGGLSSATVSTGTVGAAVANLATVYAGGLSSATVSTGTVGAAVANLGTVYSGGLSSATVSTGTVGASVANLATVYAGGLSSATVSTGQATIGQLFGSAGVPIGSLFPFAGASAPAKFLLCDGTAYSRVGYEDLFAVVALTYTPVAERTSSPATFRVPDLRGRMARGATSAALLGVAAGSDSVVLGSSHLPAHVHPLPDLTHSHGGTLGSHYHSLPSHTHPISVVGNQTEYVHNYSAVQNGGFNAVNGGTDTHYTSAPFYGVFGESAITGSTGGGSIASDLGGSKSTQNNTTTGTALPITNAHLGLNYIIKAQY